MPAKSHRRSRRAGAARPANRQPGCFPSQCRYGINHARCHADCYPRLGELKNGGDFPVGKHAEIGCGTAPSIHVAT